MMGGHQEEHVAYKNWWWGAGMVTWFAHSSADATGKVPRQSCCKWLEKRLHMVQLMPLPPHHHLLH